MGAGVAKTTQNLRPGAASPGGRDKLAIGDSQVVGIGFTPQHKESNPILMVKQGGSTMHPGRQTVAWQPDRQIRVKPGGPQRQG